MKKETVKKSRLSKQDLQDIAISESRKNEKSISWEKAKEKIRYFAK
jgi:hypothetical protein